MATLTAGTRPAAAGDLARHGPPSVRTAGPAEDRSPVARRPGRTVRSWPLLVLAAPAAAEVWSGWVGIAQKTGFGLVSPLPGIWPSLHLDTTITLPVGVEAYAAYALRAWLASEHKVSARTRRFAKWSAIFSFTLGKAGQVAYHLLAQAGVARAPWAITTIVSCLPVLVLGMGTALAHMLKADAAAGDEPGSETTGPAVPRSVAWSPADRARPDQTRPDQDRDGPDHEQARPAPVARDGMLASSASAPAATMPPRRDPGAGAAATEPGSWAAQPDLDRARVVARRLAAAGKPVSRRALRGSGVRGSNEALGWLARTMNAELAGAAAQPARGNSVARPSG